MVRLSMIMCAVAHLTWGRTVHINRSALDGRIIGGENTTIEEHPYQISLELRQRHNCGGSILTPTAVLTAAHCTYNHDPSSLQVRAGSTVRETGGVVAQVISIHDHPKYNGEVAADYDVSVIGLSAPLPLGTGVQTISLRPRGVAVEDGTAATVTGWGLIGPGAGMPANLQVLQVKKLSQASCQEVWQGSGEVTDRMTCYVNEDGDKNVCSADSGGPLVVRGKQVGIVSWGSGCSAPQYPAVYVDVTDGEVADYIEQSIANIESFFK